MKTCFLYSFILPVEEKFRDTKENKPLVSIPVAPKDGQGHAWEAAILGVPHTITSTRISIPGVVNEAIEPEDFRRVVRLQRYMLDCIRLIYDPNAEYLFHGDGAWIARTFVDPNDGPDFAIDVKQPLNSDYRVNTDGLKHLLGAEPKMRLIIRLMADSTKTTLPYNSASYPATRSSKCTIGLRRTSALVYWQRPLFPNSTPYILMSVPSPTCASVFPNCGIDVRTSD